MMRGCPRSDPARYARGLRYGMSLLLLSSLGLVIVAYMLDFSVQPAVTASYWILIILAFIIVITMIGAYISV